MAFFIHILLEPVLRIWVTIQKNKKKGFFSHEIIRNPYYFVVFQCLLNILYTFSEKNQLFLAGGGRQL